MNGRKNGSTTMFEFQFIEEEEIDMSTQFLQIQKNQFLELQQHFECYVNTSPVFGLNSGKWDLNLIKSYLLSYLIHEHDFQPTVIKKANHFVSFKFGDIQFLDVLNFLAEQHHYIRSSKLTRQMRPKDFSPMNGSTHQ